MSLPNPSKTILFAHRNGDFHKFVAALLTGSGYSLITARNGADALHKAAAFDGAIDLLLAGVDLPGMTGTELARFRCIGSDPKQKSCWSPGSTPES
jgi:CheY-like chemotaxis protein